MRELDGQIAYRRRLPHFLSIDTWYHVTFSLRKGVHLTPSECDEVVAACRHYDGTRWIIAALAALPRLGSHVLCYPLPKPGADESYSPIETIGRVKSYSAHRINAARGTSGILWERDSFDRTIRGLHDFRAVVRYIAFNPIGHGFASREEEMHSVYLHPDCLHLDWNCR